MNSPTNAGDTVRLLNPSITNKDAYSMTEVASRCHYTAFALSSPHPSAVILEGSLSVTSYAMQNNITAKRIKMNTLTIAGHNTRLQGTSITNKDAYSMTVYEMAPESRSLCTTPAPKGRRIIAQGDSPGNRRVY